MRRADERVLAVAFALAAASILAQLVDAQTTRSVWNGVYSPEQAKRGKALYAQECASCHGPAMEGRDESPPLAGAAFIANWDGHTLGELFDRIRLTMPGDDPGTLTPQNNADILAYILSVGKFPSGKAELQRETDLLNRILFAAAKP